MSRYEKTVILTAAAVFALAAVLPFLFDARLERKSKREDEVKSFLSKPLLSCMERDSSIQAASVSLVRTGSGRKPASLLLARSSYQDGEIVDEKYGIDRAPVVPEGMMMWPTLTFFIDNGVTAPHRVVSTGQCVAHGPEGEPVSGRDSMTVREALLTSSTAVARQIALDGDRRSYRFIHQLGDYFGSSDAYYLPKVWDHSLIRPAYASIADGSGIHLSQGQLLTFYDAVADGGVRPRYRYFRQRRICSEKTAEMVKELLRENVCAGTGALLADNPARIAGEAGSGTLLHGYMPGLSRLESHDPVETVSFVGFFPVESPLYTMCVTFYCKQDSIPRDASLPMAVFGKLAAQLLEKETLWK